MSISEKPSLYRGKWPKNVNKLAKYSVRQVDGDWRVTVQVFLEDDLKFLAVEEDAEQTVTRVNCVKTKLGQPPGGVFYVNEHRHILVPVKAGKGAEYYFAGWLTEDFKFAFEGRTITTKAVDVEGQPLNPGDSWVGPIPGVPYVLAAGGGDIRYDNPDFTDDDPPRVRERVTRRFSLKKVLGDPAKLQRALDPVRRVKDYTGGRFYVNEHGAMFAPVGAKDGDGIDYLYVGQLDFDCWFPAPAVGKPCVEWE